MRTFTLITDPGHGWLKVHLNDIYDINLHPTEFSSYSYRDGDWMYLEEDLDAGTFLSHYEALRGNFRIHEQYEQNDCFVRNLPRNAAADLNDSIIF